MDVKRLNITMRVKFKWWAKPIMYACVYLGLGVPKFCFSVIVTDPKGA